VSSYQCELQVGCSVVEALCVVLVSVTLMSMFMQVLYLTWQETCSHTLHSSQPSFTCPSTSCEYQHCYCKCQHWSIWWHI